MSTPALLLLIACASPARVDPDRETAPDPGGHSGGGAGHSGALPAPDGLCVNELMADNASSLADERGERSDWLELHNAGDQPAPLGGYSLSDGGEPHPLDPSLVVEPGGFLLLWADGEPGLGPDHLGLQLSAGGERLALIGPDGRTRVVSWEALEADQALARVPDCCVGEGCWRAVHRGSPGATNASPVLVEREVVPAGADWSYWSEEGPVPSGWESPGHDASTWPAGPAPLGLGVGVLTPVPTAAGAALRLAFTLSAPIDAATLRLRRDDGAIVWLDGAEVVRENLPAPGAEIAWALEPADAADAAVWREHPLDPALLAPGDHLLAVQVVGAGPFDTDLWWDAELRVASWEAP